MYVVDEKQTLLVGKEKVPAGAELPAGIEKKIGKEGLESLLKDGVIHEKKTEIPQIAVDLGKMKTPELKALAKKLGLTVKERDKKDDIIKAIKEAQGK